MPAKSLICAAAWAAIGSATAAWTFMSSKASLAMVPALAGELLPIYAVLAAFVLACLALSWALYRRAPYLRLLAYAVTIPFSLACVWALLWCSVLAMGNASALNVVLAAVPLAGLYLASATRRLT